MPKLPPKLIWSPTLAFHDPDPPLRIETSSDVEGSFQSTANVGVFSAMSGAEANASWFSSGGSSAAFFSIGDEDATWVAGGDASQVNFYGERAFVSRCEGAYTYDPLAGPAWDGTLRRDPEIMVRKAANDSPSTMSFTDEEEPALGENVQLDMGDGLGRIAGGVVQSTLMRYEGMTDQLAFDVAVADYLWLLNKRRPFGCWTNVSASVVAEELRQRFAPSDFSGAGIVPGLPNITVQFDGTLDYSGCMSVIASRIAGSFRVDDDKIIWLFQDDPAVGPAVIDDDNEDLLRDQPLTVHRDNSQLRNRVFVRGAAAKLMAGSAIGANELEIDGIDVFSPTGGEAIIGCDRFTYTGVDRTLVYPPPAESVQTVTGPATDDHLARFNVTDTGPIKTMVRYSATLVIDGRESATNGARVTNIFDVNPSVGLSLDFEDFGGFVPAGSVEWIVGLRDDQGGVWYNSNIARIATARFVPGKYTLHVAIGLPSNEVRPVAVVAWRMANIGGVVDYYEAATVPYVPGNPSYDIEDGKADASLGNRRPRSNGETGNFTYYSIGSRVYVDTLSVQPTVLDATRIKIYREEKYNGPFDNTWTDPILVMTLIPLQIQPIQPRFVEDTRSTSVLLYDANGGEANDPAPVPPPPPPKVRLVLRGVSGLDEAHEEGDEVAIFIQRDDLTAQLETAALEGGDGLHEYMVVDTNLRSNEELAVRGDAELELFSRPIVTAKYSTFDMLSIPGASVEFNLTRPPFVASLKITEVSIDKVHYNHGLRPRYNVTASSVKFTLQDLLRRTILRPY